MRVNGIIAEYNPFHNGHEYHLEESLRRTGADFTIVVMSGNFVQRGAPALLDKHIRAEMALRCGADLVLELPVLYASSSAEYFAAGAAALLDKLGVVTHLCFGSESGDALLLLKIAALLLDESGAYRSALRNFLRCGYSYPNARAEALMQCYPFLEAHREIFASPNNILGIEYCKALLRRRSAITPETVTRIGSGYHDSRTSSRFCSALAIRQALYAGNALEQLGPHIPAQILPLLSSSLSGRPPLRPDVFSHILYYKLFIEKEQGYEKYLDVSADLSNRIRNLLGKYTGFEAFCDLLKTKDMTYTRISRCLLHILLDIWNSHMEQGQEMDYAPYARALGFRKSAAPLLRAIKKHASIPLITKLADAENSLSDEALRLLKQDIRCSELYRGAAAIPSGKTTQSEYSIPLVIL